MWGIRDTYLIIVASVSILAIFQNYDDQVQSRKKKKKKEENNSNKLHATSAADQSLKMIGVDWKYCLLFNDICLVKNLNVVYTLKCKLIFNFSKATLF